MSDAVTHPTQQELAAFGLGKLSEGAAAGIAAHLELCPACRQAVARVSADSFLSKVRDAGKEGASYKASSAAQSEIPTGPCPDLPPELAHHPKYHILRELGRGGMGVVYEARHKEMERQVVIKVINRALLDRPDSLERFRREIRAAAQLSHPNIVTAYDAEQVGELHMLVMEFVPGRNLTEVVRRKGALPISVACHFARQVALGLQHAYERNLVHRDIKPQNLMLTPQGQVKILDFGLAKHIREKEKSTGLTSEHAYLGTPDYCAPEQASDAAKADIRADLYSLGCTLYYLLCGRPPFREDTFVKTILAHQQKQPQPLPELRPEVPAELGKVVSRLLAKEPTKRYEKPIEAAQALVPFITPGAKQEAKAGSALLQSTSSPAKGTVFELETSDVKKRRQAIPKKTLPKEVPAKETARSPAADLTSRSSAPRKAERSRKEEKPPLAVWWKRPAMQVAAISGALVLIMMVVILATIRDKSRDNRKKHPDETAFARKSDEPEKPDSIKRGFQGEAKKTVAPLNGEKITNSNKPPSPTNGSAKEPAPPQPPNPQETAPQSTVQRNTEGRDLEANRGAEAERIPKHFTNAIGMGLVRIPGTRETYPTTGTFWMGSPRSESQQLPQWGKGEDQHQVELSPFHLGAYEVTQRQFRAVMGYNPSYFSTNARGKDGVRYVEVQPGGGKRHIPPGELTEDYPVENVSWEEAREFCEKLTARGAKEPTGWVYRLPTEAEWEYACRGGTSGYQMFAFGNSIISTQANFAGVNPWPLNGAKGPNLRRTCKVGQYRPNGFELYDMHGNVWEWCGDWFSEDYYRKSPWKNPTGPADDTGARVARGGSWDLNGWDCRSARRSGVKPTKRHFEIGFRVVLVPPGKPSDPPKPMDTGLGNRTKPENQAPLGDGFVSLFNSKDMTLHAP